MSSLGLSALCYIGFLICMYHVQNCSPKLQFMQFELVRPIYILKQTSLIIQEPQTDC
jgi:hypothetical protein